MHISLYLSVLADGNNLLRFDRPLEEAVDVDVTMQA